MCNCIQMKLWKYYFIAGHSWKTVAEKPANWWQYFLKALSFQVETCDLASSIL